MTDIGGKTLDEARRIAEGALPAFDLDAMRKRVERSRKAAGVGRQSKVYRVYADRADLLAMFDRADRDRRRLLNALLNIYSDEGGNDRALSTHERAFDLLRELDPAGVAEVDEYLRATGRKR